MKNPNKKESELPYLKEFLLTLIATTISIVLTFGTSAVIEKRQKEGAKREMVLMIIYDFDKTIEQVQQTNFLLQQANQAQQQIAIHPQYFDSLRYLVIPATSIAYYEFSETTEKIFSSNIETFNTLGNVNFVHEVSSFYNTRNFYKKMIVERIKNEMPETLTSFEGLLCMNYPEYYFTTCGFLRDMQKKRNRCMQMMKVSEEELQRFSQQRTMDEDDRGKNDTTQIKLIEELYEAEHILDQAKEKLEQNQQTEP